MYKHKLPEKEFKELLLKEFDLKNADNYLYE